MSLDAPASFAAPPDVASYRVALVAARFNTALVDALLRSALDTLRSAGVPESGLTVVRVPGSHEVPWAAGRLAASGRYDVLVGLGVLIAGDTNHHEMVGDAVAHALQAAAARTGVPIVNGVIVTNTLAQAEARAAGPINRGAEFGSAAIELAALHRTLP